jgi:hypothetical protein
MQSITDALLLKTIFAAFNRLSRGVARRSSNDLAHSWLMASTRVAGSVVIQSREKKTVIFAQYQITARDRLSGDVQTRGRGGFSRLRQQESLCSEFHPIFFRSVIETGEQS